MIALCILPTIFNTSNKIPMLYRRGQDTADRRILDKVTRDFSWQAAHMGRAHEDWEIPLAANGW